MNIDALWENYGIRQSAIEFAKALKKDEALAKLKLEFFLSQVEKVSEKKTPDLKIHLPEPEELELDPFNPDEAIVSTAPTPGQKYDKFQTELIQKLQGKLGVFFETFDVNFPVNDIPIMLENCKLPFVMPEGPNLYQGPLAARVTENGLEKPTRQAEVWQVKFHPKG